MRRKKKSYFGCFFRLLFLLLLVAGGYYLYHHYRILKQVYQYESMVETAVQEQGIPEYKDLAMGIIYTESKGQGADPMQSSESAYGEPQQIQDPQESIEQGVAYLAKAITRAEEQQTDLWAAVQAYNFGLEYIDYVAKNGGENSIELAESYSRDILSPLLGNEDQTTYRYLGWQSIIYNGGYLYHNGGNLFYAELVKINEQKVKWTAFWFERNDEAGV
ncbi:lysozyme family protein [Enterococcus olivae]